MIKSLSLVIIFYLSFHLISCGNYEESKSEKKYESIVTKYTELQQIVSSEVNDTFYVFIRLPKHYSSTDKMIL